MRTLPLSRVYAMRATMRANRWPLPGLGPVEIVHPSPSAATLRALAMVRETIACAMLEREIAVSYSVTDYSDTPWHVTR